MKAFILGLILTVSQTTFAKETCYFPYDLSEEAGVEDLRSFGIKSAEGLTSLQAFQVVTTANRRSDAYIFATEDLGAAIRTLRADSEAGDLIYSVFRYRGVVYSKVEIFPGGNSFGVIFKGSTVIATQNDGDVTCE